MVKKRSALLSDRCPFCYQPWSGKDKCPHCGTTLPQNAKTNVEADFENVREWYTSDKRDYGDKALDDIDYALDRLYDQYDTPLHRRRYLKDMNLAEREELLSRI